jgi:membrane protein DedA with SNARE-associated domain
VWAAGALVLPWLVRGRSVVIDLVAAVIWSAVLVSATRLAVSAAAWPGHGFGPAPNATLGAVVAAAVALAPTVLCAWRRAGTPAEGSEPGFP